MSFSASQGSVAISECSTPDPVEPTATQRLDELRARAEFARLVHGAASEVMRVWNVPRRTAAGFVMSAVGEPRTLACIHRSLFSDTGTAIGLAKVIVRRRVLDLLRSDVRRPHHESLPLAADDVDDVLGSLADDPQHGPHAQAELDQLVDLIRAALHSFATLGPVQERQAELLRRHALDEVACADLAPQLACTENALRVRIHKALRALRRHIETCHRALSDYGGGEPAR